jgi:TetR/AcrR family transcriptional regulator, tetracycline repressor protein
VVNKSARSASDVPRGRGLSLDRIVTETLALIDEQGIGMASMRTVAARLDVRAMSLYRYVETREELFDAVVERVVNELSDDPQVQDRPSAGWRPYLSSIARGVRRYARAHPHAFPLVATRPPAAPWVNPPLRSLRWIEAMLRGLQDEGFTDDQVLFAYRTFNSFLLGYLLLETSAMALTDPKPGDGSFARGDRAGGSDPVDPTDPVPGGLSPTRSAEHRNAIADADTARDLVDPVGEVSVEDYPTVHQLRAGLSEDHYEEEFETGLGQMMDRIQRFLTDTSTARGQKKPVVRRPKAVRGIQKSTAITAQTCDGSRRR